MQWSLSVLLQWFSNQFLLSEIYSLVVFLRKTYKNEFLHTQNSLKLLNLKGRHVKISYLTYVLFPWVSCWIIILTSLDITEWNSECHLTICTFLGQTGFAKLFPKSFIFRFHWLFFKRICFCINHSESILFRT